MLMFGLILGFAEIVQLFLKYMKLGPGFCKFSDTFWKIMRKMDN